MKVLVVDDDELLVEQLRRYLDRNDYQTLAAHSAEDALALLANTQPLPEVVITDIRMGPMNGLDLVTKVHKSWPNIFTIVMTGYATIEVAVDAMRRGAFDFITKPFRVSLLKSKLELITDELAFRRDLGREADAVKAPSLHVEPFDLLGQKAAEMPVLAITPRSPEAFRQHSGLARLNHRWLTYEKAPGAISPKHLHRVQMAIEGFVQENPRGLVYLEGLGQLIELHEWPAVWNLVTRLHGLCSAADYFLYLGIEADELKPEERGNLEAIFTDDTILTISRSLAHPARLSILTYLNQGGESTFNRILKELGFPNSAALTFHLKHLVKAHVIDRTASGSYRISPQGRLAIDTIDIFRQAGMADLSQPGSLLLSVTTRD